MSSVFGLKVRPSIAIFFSLTSPPQAVTILRAIERLRAVFTATVVSTSLSGLP